MTFLQKLKQWSRSQLKTRGLYVFTSGSLPRNVELSCDLARFSDAASVRVVFDIGANVGDTAASYLDWFPHAQIYAFEPVSETHHHLAQRFASEARITRERIALSDRSGEGIMRFGDNSLLSHLREDDGSALVSGGEERVPTTTVDEYCAMRKITAIDLLKTDTEGNDLAVLYGARDLLSQGKVRFVLAEVGFSAQQPGHTFLGSVFDELTSKGFFFYGLYDTRHMTYRPELHFADALFVHESQLA